MMEAMWYLMAIHYICSYELRDREAPEQLVVHVRKIAAALVSFHHSMIIGNGPCCAHPGTLHLYRQCRQIEGDNDCLVSP